MRQAGRYLPEYNATRARAGSFLALATNPALATEVTLQPLERFPLDAAILFSDILTVPDAMGLGLSFAEGEGPRFERPLRDEARDRARSPCPTWRELRYVFDAVRADPQRARRARAADRLLRQPVDARLLHGRRRRQRRLRDGAQDGVCAARPAAPDPRDQRRRGRRLSATRRSTAGAQAVMMFDTWGGVLPPTAYRAFSLGADARGARPRSPAATCRRSCSPRAAAVARRRSPTCGATCVGLDWTVDLARRARRVGDRVALQGNLDPLALLTDPATVERAAQRRSFAPPGPEPGYIFNLGHGIVPATPPENVAALVDAVHPRRRHDRSAPAAIEILTLAPSIKCGWRSKRLHLPISYAHQSAIRPTRRDVPKIA